MTVLDWPRMRRKEKNKNGSMENPSKFSEGEERRKRGESDMNQRHYDGLYSAQFHGCPKSSPNRVRIEYRVSHVVQLALLFYDYLHNFSG